MPKGREEQQLPDINDSEYCQDSVQPRIIGALEESKQQGVLKYGTALQPFNGRDVQQDMEEEVLDLVVYMEQNRREREALILFVRKVHGFPGLPDTISLEAFDLLVGLGVYK